MAVKLNSTGGGSVTLDSPSTASNYTITLPSAAGTLATTTGTGSVFTNPTINGFTGDTSAITVGTTQFVKDTSGNIGIGTASPANKVHISGDGSASLLKVQATNTNGTASINLVPNGTGNGQIYTESGALLFSPTNTERMRLDSSGNLGLGVTPSGWSNSGNIQIGGGGQNIVCTSSVGLGANWYYNGGYKYYGTGLATNYVQETGIHKWYTAPSGTAGNAITFGDPKMTLDASGNLLVGATSNSGVRLYVKGASATSADWSIYAVNSAGTTQFGLRNDNYFYAPSIGGYGTTGTAVVVNGNYLGYLSSSLRFKKDVVDYDKGLLEILSLRPVYYKSKNPNPDGEYDEQRYAGLIAEEIAELGFSEFVLNGPDGQINSIQYGNMVALCVKAIQELSAQNQALEARLAQLEAK